MNNEKYFRIQIPKPCHKNWNKMLPDEKGKFCQSCQKSVYDFSNKSDEEIYEIVSSKKDEKLCGRFCSTQLNRPINPTVKLDRHPGNISVTKAFVIALFLVFGAFLFSCVEQGEQKARQAGMEAHEKEILMGEVNSHSTKIQAEVRIDLIKTDTVAVSEFITKGQIMVAGGLRFVDVDTTDSKSAAGSDTPLNTVGTGTTEWPETYIPGGAGNAEILIEHSEQDSLIVADTLNKTGSENQLNTDETRFQIFPNPSVGNFTLAYLLNEPTVVYAELLDVKGVLLETLIKQSMQHSGQYRMPIGLSHLPNGVYLCRLRLGEKVYQQKVIIQP